MSGSNTATAPIKATGENYRPDLDGIRAFCILFTVAYHIPNVPHWINGSVGVDIFFGLSGWLITSLLIREREEQGAVNLPGFYIRRVFRILPLYYLTVGLYLAASLATHQLPDFLHAAPSLIAMIPEYKNHIGMMGHAWTIGVEEKFYLFWPLILLVFAGNRKMMAVAAIMTALVLVFAFGFKPQILRGYAGLAFGAGLSVAAYGTTAVRAFLSRSIAAPALAAMGAAYACSILIPHAWFWNVLVSCFGSVMIASLWFTKGQGTARFLSFGPLPWLGRLTYAIYLLQSLCINVAEKMTHGFWRTFLLSYAISIAAAWAVHVTVEKPLIRAGKRLASAKSRRAYS